MKTMKTKRPEDTIHGKKITRREVMKGLPPKKDWAKLKRKIMRNFRKKPKQ
jgi:hypothetical protein